MQYVEHKILTTKTAKRKSFPRWERQSAKADAKADLARRFGLLMRSDFAASQAAAFGRRMRKTACTGVREGWRAQLDGARKAQQLERVSFSKALDILA
jgi:hypothetical protein